jgi:hypothetical protein
MHTCVRQSLWLFLVAIVGSSFLLSQTQPPVSDPQALALAGQAIAAVTNGITVSDATLTGNAAWIAGSDIESGTATLQAKGTAESRTDLSLSGGMRTEIRNSLASPYPRGASVRSGGSQRSWALHNCWAGGSWFFPALSVLAAASDPSVIFLYLGQEMRSGVSVQHIQTYRYLSGQRPATISLTQKVSTTDIYLDSTSILPVSILYNSHPDEDALTNIAVEIDFVNYQPVNGVQVPFRIQKLISGGLALQIDVTGASFNTGISDSTFAIE